jgi:ribosome biogenesis GTPase
VLVANVDTVLLVSGLDRDFNPRRLERYLTAAWDSGADPVIVLAKLDLCTDPTKILEAEAVAMGVPVLPVSNVSGEGIDAVRALLEPGRTLVALGSSGVGKSSLVNRLAGRRVMPTADLRRDGRGRHRTRHRQLLVLPGGALFVDTPGLRELQVWEGDLGSAFADIAELASRCRFSDCAHRTEPDCAVREALESGDLPAERWANYLKLQRELRVLEARRSSRVHRELKRRWRQRARETKQARRRGGKRY